MLAPSPSGRVDDSRVKVDYQACSQAETLKNGPNHLLHRLILDHDILSYFWTTLKKFKKKFKLSYEYF